MIGRRKPPVARYDFRLEWHRNRSMDWYIYCLSDVVRVGCGTILTHPSAHGSGRISTQAIRLGCLGSLRWTWYK